MKDFATSLFFCITFIGCWSLMMMTILLSCEIAFWVQSWPDGIRMIAFGLFGVPLCVHFSLKFVRYIDL